MCTDRGVLAADLDVEGSLKARVSNESGGRSAQKTYMLASAIEMSDEHAPVRSRTRTVGRQPSVVCVAVDVEDRREHVVVGNDGTG